MLESILSDFSSDTVIAKEIITYQFKYQKPLIKWFFNYRHSFSNKYILLYAVEIFGTCTSSCEASFSTIEHLFRQLIITLCRRVEIYPWRHPW